MYETTWLLYASIAAWGGLAVYLFSLNRRNSELEKRLYRLEQSLRERNEE